MAGLDLQLYNDPVLLWDKILEELDEETLLILPSQLARKQFLQRQGDKAIWSGNILTVLDIRKKIKDIMDLYIFSTTQTDTDLAYPQNLNSNFVLTGADYIK